VQLEFFDVPSPCIGICQADEKGYCLGCLRTRDERQTWKNFSNDDKQKVIKRCMQRKKRKAKRIEKEKHIDEPLDKLAEQDIVNNIDENKQPSLLPIESATENNVTVSQNDDIDFDGFEL
jgi:predicted Fe-S protein YdhL (DUF1289 family)